MKKDPRPILKKAVEIIQEGDSDTPILDAELLFIKAMKSAGELVSRTRVAAGLDVEIPEGVAEKLMEFARLRAAGKPVQYITGEQEFMGLDFHVTEGVLIPRPDTEVLVETVLDHIKEHEGEIRVLDLCTGTGAIGISILHHNKRAKAVLADISEIAYKVSLENAFRSGVSERCVVLRGDLFEPLGEMSFDVIVSNPPYIRTEEIGRLMEGVKDFEPHLALDGGADGLAFYRKITGEAPKHLKQGGLLAFEIGYDQGREVEEIMRKNRFVEIRVVKDLAGHDRCVVGRLNYTSSPL